MRRPFSRNHISFNDFGKVTPVNFPPGIAHHGNGPHRPLPDPAPVPSSIIPWTRLPCSRNLSPSSTAEANGRGPDYPGGDGCANGREGATERSRRTGANRARTINRTNNRQPQNRGNQSNSRQLTGIGTADQPAAQLIPDDRLNRIMVVASPSDAAYILELIREFDQPLEPPQPVERPLQYVKANDILPVIVDILQDTGTGENPAARRPANRLPPHPGDFLPTRHAHGDKHHGTETIKTAPTRPRRRRWEGRQGPDRLPDRRGGSHFRSRGQDTDYRGSAVETSLSSWGDGKRSASFSI